MGKELLKVKPIYLSMVSILLMLKIYGTTPVCWKFRQKQRMSHDI